MARSRLKACSRAADTQCPADTAGQVEVLHIRTCKSSGPKSSRAGHSVLSSSLLSTPTNSLHSTGTRAMSPALPDLSTPSPDTPAAYCAAHPPGMAYSPHDATEADPFFPCDSPCESPRAPLDPASGSLPHALVDGGLCSSSMLPPSTPWSKVAPHVAAWLLSGSPAHAPAHAAHAPPWYEEEGLILMTGVVAAGNSSCTPELCAARSPPAVREWRQQGAGPGTAATDLAWSSPGLLMMTHHMMA